MSSNKCVGTCPRSPTALESSGTGKDSGPWQGASVADGNSSGAGASLNCTVLNVRDRRKDMVCGWTTKANVDGRCRLHKKARSASQHLNKPAFPSATPDTPLHDLLDNRCGVHKQTPGASRDLNGPGLLSATPDPPLHDMLNSHWGLLKKLRSASRHLNEPGLSSRTPDRRLSDMLDSRCGPHKKAPSASRHLNGSGLPSATLDPPLPEIHPGLGSDHVGVDDCDIQAGASWSMGSGSAGGGWKMPWDGNAVGGGKGRRCSNPQGIGKGAS